MILDDIRQAGLYVRMHGGFDLAFSFLAGLPSEPWQPGRRELEGDRVFALMSDCSGRGREAARLEFHRKYIDIQAVLDGRDEIGWRKLGDCARVAEPYDEAKDIGFMREAPDLWVPLDRGAFVVLFPGDAHAPLAGCGDMRKVVVKIAV
jgi:biofilm protein TabA